jgi:hypothetical protein
MLTYAGGVLMWEESAVDKREEKEIRSSKGAGGDTAALPVGGKRLIDAF